MSDREKDALVGNAADEEQVQQASEKENRKQNELKRAWRELLALDCGRVVVRDLIEFCEPLKTPFRTDERYTVLAIGRGDVGRYMIEQMDRVNPQWLTTLMQELPKSPSRKHVNSHRNARRSRPRADRQE